MSGMKPPRLDIIKDDLQRVEDDAKRRLTSRVPLITEVAQHLILAGGKRFRPALLILAARLCGYRGQDHIPLAVVIEFIHGATLLHDDVIDNAEIRRGSASANALWGNEASVLVGDFLYCRSLDIMVEVGNMRVLQTLARATTALAEGETMELVNTADLSVSEDQNLELIVNKTAVLISSSTRIGAILGEAPTEMEERLANYGLHAGIAFQLVDDCLDYVGEREVLGKATASDLSEGKITLPMIHTLQQCSAREQQTIEDMVTGKTSPDGTQWKQILLLVEKYGGIYYTLSKAQHHVDEAKRNLESAPDCDARRLLLDLADYVTKRRL